MRFRYRLWLSLLCGVSGVIAPLLGYAITRNNQCLIKEVCFEEYSYMAQPVALITRDSTTTSTAIPTQTPEASQFTIPDDVPTSLQSFPEYHILEGIRYEYQGWNNCGPTTLAMQLSYWGHTETQTDIAIFLKPDPKDEHVHLSEMQGYVQTLGLEAITRFGGDRQLLKGLLLAGFPVLVETWHVRAADDQLGHYQLVVGYDNANEVFVLYDSLLGPDYRVAYAQFDEAWHVFNRVFFVAYPPEREIDLVQALGMYANQDWALEQALLTSQNILELQTKPCVVYADCEDVHIFSWFNVGTNLLALQQYNQAALAYEQAYASGWPRRMLWYQFGPYEAYYYTGKFEDVIYLADETLASGVRSEEAYYWRGRAKLALGDLTEAQRDFETALCYHPGWHLALEMQEHLKQ